MRYIFISYAREDTEAVDRVAAALRDADFEISIDREKILGGEQWPEVIAEEIEAADGILLVLSANSLASRHVRQETHFAYEKQKLFFPITLEKLGEMPKSFSLPLAAVQRIDFAADFEDGLGRLLTALRNTGGTRRSNSMRGAQQAVDTLRDEIFNLPTYKEMQHQIAEIENNRSLSASDRKFFAAMFTGGYLDKLREYLIEQRARVDERSVDYISDEELRQLQYRKDAIDGEIAKIERTSRQKLAQSRAIVEEDVNRTRELMKRRNS